MTPYEFCNWLRGYVAADTSAVNNDILLELSRVDMTAFFIPPVTSDDQTPPPASPPSFSPRDDNGWEAPWYWDYRANCWRKDTPDLVAKYYRDLFLHRN